MTINKDTVAYRLIQTAFEIARIQSLGHAKDFLVHNINRLDMPYWVKLAIRDEFLKYVKENGRVVKK